MKKKNDLFKNILLRTNIRSFSNKLDLPNDALDVPNGVEWAACNKSWDVVDGTPLTDDECPLKALLFWRKRNYSKYVSWKNSNLRNNFLIFNEFYRMWILYFYPLFAACAKWWCKSPDDAPCAKRLYVYCHGTAGSMISLVCNCLNTIFDMKFFNSNNRNSLMNDRYHKQFIHIFLLILIYF